MQATQQFTEAHELLGELAPITVNGAVGAHTTGYLSVGDVHRAVALLFLGTPGAAGSTIDVTVQEAKDSDGTDAQDLDDKSPVQLTAGDTGGIVAIEIQTEEMSVEDGYDHLQVTVTVGTNTYTYSLMVFGFPLRYAPADVTNLVEVVE